MFLNPHKLRDHFFLYTYSLLINYIFYVEIWNKLKKWLSDKVYGEPLDDELDEVLEKHKNLSDEEKLKQKRSLLELDKKTELPFLIPFILVSWIGYFGYGMYKGQTFYEVFDDDNTVDIVLLPIFLVVCKYILKWNTDKVV